MSIVGPDNALVDDEEERHVDIHPFLYPLSLAIVAAFWIILGAILFFAGIHINLWLINLNFGILIWIVGVLHFAEGFYVVPAEEIGGVYLFGIPTIEVSGFPVVLLMGIHRLTTYTLQVFEVRVPTDPEKIYRAKQEDHVPLNLAEDGFKPPIRVPFAGKRSDGKEANKEDPLERRSTNEVSFYARLQIQKFFDFDIRIGSMESAEKQIEGIGVNFVNSELTKMTVAEALEKTEENSRALEGTMRKETKHWGVKVVTAKIRLIEFSHSFNKKIEEIPEAEAQRQITILDGEGNGRKFALEGQGRAEAEKADLVERAAGLKKMAQELGVSVETILAAETARAVAEGNNEKIILPGLDGIAGIVGAVANGFRNTKPNGAS